MDADCHRPCPSASSIMGGSDRWVPRCNSMATPMGHVVSLMSRARATSMECMIGLATLHETWVEIAGASGTSSSWQQ